MVFEKNENYYILRYIIYEFLEKVLCGAGLTSLVKIVCDYYVSTEGVAMLIETKATLYSFSKGPAMYLT